VWAKGTMHELDEGAFHLPIVAFFFFFRTDYMDSPDCLLILLNISVFYILVFSVFHFLVLGPVR